MADIEAEEKQKRKNLSGDERRALFLYLLQFSDGKNKLPHGVVPLAAEKFGVCFRVVGKIWKIGKQTDPDNPAQLLKNLSPQKKKKKMWKKKVGASVE